MLVSWSQELAVVYCLKTGSTAALQKEDCSKAAGLFPKDKYAQANVNVLFFGN